jgi:hypothetical protein
MGFLPDFAFAFAQEGRRRRLGGVDELLILE